MILQWECLRSHIHYWRHSKQLEDTIELSLVRFLCFFWRVRRFVRAIFIVFSSILSIVPMHVDVESKASFKYEITSFDMQRQSMLNVQIYLENNNFRAQSLTVAHKPWVEEKEGENKYSEKRRKRKTRKC